ncbi:hypothetical protein [Nitrobacter sp.]|uniref:hypothetical protein n=1 Tax=Nitrobacter sp. TaxID=29420 RepID=UPI0029CAB4F5|nr:hypothetical protein [Nitrobacter sp.]
MPGILVCFGIIRRDARDLSTVLAMLSNGVPKSGISISTSNSPQSRTSGCAKKPMSSYDLELQFL